MTECQQKIKELREIIPSPSKCMGASLYANGGHLLKEIITPNWEEIKNVFARY